nr:hypothetical protein [Prochloraceae cyanobacterium]
MLKNQVLNRHSLNCPQPSTIEESDLNLFRFGFKKFLSISLQYSRENNLIATNYSIKLVKSLATGKIVKIYFRLFSDWHKGQKVEEMFVGGLTN